mmetsp:Transcript_122300/g.222471  ORF Transcript_122300/g.222471 Transcript_122300/m.222471 type:complete len:212 (+) Transcript_122300:1051-1686(+)
MLGRPAAGCSQSVVAVGAPAPGVRNFRHDESFAYVYEVLTHLVLTSTSLLPVESGINKEVKFLLHADCWLYRCGHVLFTHEPCGTHARCSSQATLAALEAAGTWQRHPQTCMWTDATLEAHCAIPLTSPRVERAGRACNGLCVGKIWTAHVSLRAHDATVSRCGTIFSQWTSTSTIRCGAANRAEMPLEAWLWRCEIVRLRVQSCSTLVAR